MDDRYRVVALVVVVTTLTATLGAVLSPHGWPVPVAALVGIALLCALPVGWLVRSMVRAVVASLAVGIAIGAPFVAPIALTLLALAALGLSSREVTP